MSVQTISTDLEPREIIKAAFSVDGVIARSVPDFEERPHQLEMALAVWDSLTAPSHLLIEAGTGIGKSLAYIFPALLWSYCTGHRIVVSTHTVNLQQQLVGKDIPLVASLFSQAGFEPKYCLFKGRSHYLCLRRWRQSFADTAQKTSLFVANAEERALQDLFEVIAEGTWDGDRDTLPTSIPDAAWADICSESDRCMSSKCKHKSECYYQKHRRRLEECHLIVVNHALFAAHLAVASESADRTRLLPGFEAAIFDEAHHLEDVFRDSLGKEVSPGRLKRLADDTIRLASSGAIGKSITRDGVRRLREELDNRVSAVVDALYRLDPERSGQKEKARLRRVGSIDPEVMRSLREFGKEIAYWEDLDLSDEERFEVAALRRRFSALADDLRDISDLEGDGDSYVYWAESQEGARRTSQVALKKAPLEVGPYLQEELWSVLPSAILTSATLTAGSSFDYQKRMLSLTEARELALDSPFDYRNQACFCIPQDCRGQDVNTPPFNDYVAQKVLEIVDMVEGRTFVLFTNRKSMERVASAVRDRIEEKGYPFMKQGDAPREALLREFKEKGNAVLMGLDSFWEGVDVPGDALSCVVITKLPFPVPDDPVMEAREDLWRSQGLVPFTHYSLPLATLKLKQGFGRLIRTKSDRGAVVLLDPRIATKTYGRSILRSLPPARLTFDLEDIAKAVSPPRK